MGGYERGCEYAVAKSGRSVGESERAPEEYEGCLRCGKRGLCKRMWRVRYCLTAKRECGGRRM